VHFQCLECGSTQCIDEVTIPFVKLPKGFLAEKIEMVITGHCNICSQKITTGFLEKPISM
jgi:Fur family ferric uptake transcriptional regulator